ncbi:phosphoglyceromutase [Neisseria gonorrhoeae]|uniref:Phosphoglyceromutase n=1 Tax=Neisseria gonorrhoeae TaxID=485 RepID=A0A378VUU3_NEIGO|nr:phosphoglyceromutase [Neisseria gonorrhoeae]
MEREKPVYRLARREAERAGLAEAAAAGKKLKENGYEFDIAFTSVLTRAIKTCNIVWKNPTNCSYRKSKHGG